MNAIAASTSQAELAGNLPEGRWASGPLLRSAMTWIGVHADSSMPAIAALMVAVILAVIENRAPPRRAALTMSWV